MHNQHLFVIGSVEDADPAAFRQTLRATPQKIMLQFRGTRVFEAERLTALGIDAGHDVPDGTVLACCIHGLKNQQQRITIGRVVQVLQRAQFIHLFCQEFVILFLRLVHRFQQRRPLLEIDFFALLNLEIL
jgi:hypothetical protein